MPGRRASGILLHPTSLPGRFGAGDLGEDAYQFVDWLAAAGQRLWQVLPLGEIGPGNSPYMSRSAFAGNVLLIDLMELNAQGWLDASALEFIPAANPHRIDFDAVIPARMNCLRSAAEGFARLATPDLQADFATFCAQHTAWLDDYALFMALVTAQGSDDWTLWPAPLAARTEAALAQARDQYSADIRFWKFCQWCFARQWQRLKRYANDRGVALIGDMPIFVAHQSADVWAHPDLFELDAQGNPTVVAGVPPDYFSETGQFWGNPLYCWPRHAETGFAWWRQRVQHAVAQLDLIRIDHFRGFVAYWEIPAGEQTAVNGKWVAGPGAELFSALRASEGALPFLAEDLGDITDDVIALRDALGLPGMRVLQFAFCEDAQHPFLPHIFERNTVAYTGTHDNDTLLGWWHSASPRERAFIQHYLGSDGHALHWDAIRALSASVADRVIFPMQDILGLGTEHRMNRPGLPTGNWGWRFTWEQLQAWQGSTLAHLSAVHGRCDLSLGQLPD